MATVTMHVAKTKLSELLARAEAGEEIILARGREPVAKLVPLKPAAPRRQPGSLKGKIWLDDSFFDPLPEEELKLWGL